MAAALLAAGTCLAPLLPAAPAAAQSEVPVPLARASSPARAVVFGYSAQVAPNDVYDTARAEAPQPVFRALGERVDVRADYTGPAARLRLLARLSSATGWSSTVPLAGEVGVTGRGRVGGTLDLPRLEARAAVVAEQTGMPFEGMTVELVAAVRDDRGVWAPSVALQLSPQQLRLAGAPSTLLVRQEPVTTAGSARPPAPTPGSLLADLVGWRPGGLLVSLVLALAGAGGALVAGRRHGEDAVGRARRRLGRLLLDVRPLDLSGVRMVEVDSPDALARLAERYGLLVLHWSDGSGPVFVVQDEAVVYRWRPAASGADDVEADQLRERLARVVVPVPRGGEEQDRRASEHYAVGPLRRADGALLPEPSSRQVG